MALLKKIIQIRSKGRLRKTDTYVTKPDGTKYLETTDESGRTNCTKLYDSDSLGYVGDMKPDLQVCKITSHIFLDWRTGLNSQCDEDPSKDVSERTRMDSEAVDSYSEEDGDESDKELGEPVPKRRRVDDSNEFYEGIKLGVEKRIKENNETFASPDLNDLDMNKKKSLLDEIKSLVKSFQRRLLNDYISLGSVDAASELPLLEEICVTHILDATSMSLEYFPGRFILDLPQADIISGLDDCFSFIDEAVKNNGKVLVHCMAGISRSSSIVIGYLMKSNNMSFEEALEHVKTQRPATNPNSGFRDQLKRYSPLKNISDTADADT